MSTATTTSHDTGQQTSPRGLQREAQQPVMKQKRNAAQRLRFNMAAMTLSFTWLGARKTLAPEQRTTAAREFHAARELLTASKLILDTKNPAYRAVAAVYFEVSSYSRYVAPPFPEAGVRLLPQNSLGLFAQTMQTYRERLQEVARVSHGPAPGRVSGGAAPGCVRGVRLPSSLPRRLSPRDSSGSRPTWKSDSLGFTTANPRSFVIQL